MELCRGALWDISTNGEGKDRERLWAWGANFLFMFDVSRDFPIENKDEKEKEKEAANGDGEKRQGKKRKRGGKSATGAGGVINENSVEALTIGIGRKVQRLVYEEFEEVHDLGFLKKTVGEGEGDSDVDMGLDEDEDDALAEMRREEAGENVNGNAESKEGEEGETLSNKPKRRLHWWQTFKYRPILGIALLGGGAGSAEEVADGTTKDAREEAFEVAVVERPIWDVDLPPRVYGDQEWEKAPVYGLKG